VAAGRFYPQDPRALADLVARLLVPSGPRPRALVAPHAGYRYSGRVAGRAFGTLVGARVQRVYLLGPAHFVPFPGVSTGPYRAFQTPLGEVEVDKEAVRRLLQDPLFTDDPRPHEEEHSLEVELPFLQVALGTFRLVPLLFGQVDPEKVASALALEADDLLVVSTDLSHYHPEAVARALDAETLELALRLDAEGLARREACGLLPWLSLTHLARRLGLRPRLLAYATSGEVGDKARVVGYAALAYF